jgi:hypothetical protein
VVRRNPSQHKKGRTGIRGAGVSLDSEASQILQLIMRAFVRCGYSPPDVAREFAAHGRKVLRATRRIDNDVPTKDDDWVQVLTLWTMDPEYVDDRGMPRTLRARSLH